MRDLALHHCTLFGGTAKIIWASVIVPVLEACTHFLLEANMHTGRDNAGLFVFALNN